MEDTTNNPIIDCLRAVEDAHNARMNDFPPEPIGENATPEEQAAKLAEVTAYLRRQREAEASVDLKAPHDDGGMAEAVHELLHRKVLTPDQIRAAGDIIVSQDPAGVTIGTVRREVPPQILPFEGAEIVLFDGICMVDSANSSTNYNGTYEMHNTKTTYAATTEQRLLMHLASPVTGAAKASLLCNVAAIMQTTHFFDDSGMNPLSSNNVSSHYVYCWPIIEDFDPSVVDWDDWFDNPSGAFPVIHSDRTDYATGGHLPPDVIIGLGFELGYGGTDNNIACVRYIRFDATDFYVAAGKGSNQRAVFPITYAGAWYGLELQFGLKPTQVTFSDWDVTHKIAGPAASGLSEYNFVLVE